jgi:hypothetical protein
LILRSRRSPKFNVPITRSIEIPFTGANEVR